MNYRRYFAMAAVMLLLCCFVTAAFANNVQVSPGQSNSGQSDTATSNQNNSNGSNNSGGQIQPASQTLESSFVFDHANLFSDTEEAYLQSRASEISRRFNVGIYIITVNDYTVYTSRRDVYQGLLAFFDSNGLGLGSDRAAVSLMLSMSERDYALDFNSDRAQYAFTEAGRDRMENRFLSYFRNNDFYGGYREYLNTCEEYLQAAEAGTPVGQGERSSADGPSLVWAFLPGAIASLITGLAMSSVMHSAKLKKDAAEYAVEGSMILRRRSDMFINRTVVRRARQTQSSSGFSHHSSGSHSGRSGKF